jgi:hypothetical protein
LPTETNPHWHYERDVFDVLNQGWDLMIAHPPCTYLSVSGIHWKKKYPEREQYTEDAWKLRSKTYQGIADAMAEQWGSL